MPSEASSVFSDFRNARTSMSIALSIGASRPSSTASMMSRVAIGGAAGGPARARRPGATGAPCAVLAGARLRLVGGPAFLGQPVDEAEGQAFRSRHLRAEDEELERLGAADEARQALRAAEARGAAQGTR